MRSRRCWRQGHEVACGCAWMVCGRVVSRARKSNRLYRKTLGRITPSDVEPAQKPPNDLIDVARAKLAEDPTGAALDAWRDEYLTVVKRRGRKYRLLASKVKERVIEAYDIARAEAGLG